MEQKSKIIIIILGVLVFFTILFAVKINNDKQALLREYQEEKEAWRIKEGRLEEEIRNIKRQRDRLKERLDAIQDELDRVESERRELKSKYESIVQEKEDLIKKLKEKSRAAAAPSREISQSARGVPSVSDEYWAKILKEKAALEFELSKVKDEYKKLKLRIEEFTKEKTDLELELTDIKHKNADLERKYSYNEKLLDSLSAELVREKNDKQAIKEQVKVIKNENMLLRRQLKRAVDSKLRLQEKIVKLEDEKKKLEEKLAGVETAVIEKETVLKETAQKISGIKDVTEKSEAGEEKAVELSPIVVHAPDSSAGVSGRELTGRVVAVDSEYNFVVIDIGEDAGVSIGMDFEVYQQDERIGTVRVIQTRKSISAADIIQSSRPIKTGDLVR